MSTVRIPISLAFGMGYKNRMDINAILDRISARRAVLGLSESAVSASAKSRDLIRNWRRAAKSGARIEMKHESLASVARVLGVSTSWLINGGTEVPAAPAPAHFGEDATPYRMPAGVSDEHEANPILGALYGSVATTPATYRVPADLPAFAIMAGDVVVVDLARLPIPGDLALVTLADENAGTAMTFVRRYLPPFLVSGGFSGENSFLRIDTPGLNIRCPVVGILRGLT